MAISYTPLEGEITREITGSTLTYDGASPSFFASASFLYTLFFVAIVLAASYRYTLAGILRMEASESGINKSKEVFKKTTFGLLGVLSLWLILFTVNKDLLTGDVGLDALKVKPITSGGETSGGGGASGTYPSDGVAKLATLNAAGITLNKAPCSETQLKQTSGIPSCTSVDGLPQETIDMLLQLKNSCVSCTVVLTGGTEPGHHTHGPTLRPVDLRIVNEGIALYNHITTKGTPVPNQPKKWTYLNFIFWDEPGGDPHFHAY